MRSARRIVPGLLLVVIAVAVFTASSQAAPRSYTRLTSLETGVLSDINNFRAQHGLARLTLSRDLTAAASDHSSEMATDGYFAHTSFDGQAFWKRIQQFYSSSSWPYWSVGENLLWSSPDVDADGALKLWIASPEHLANLLNPRWRQVGISAVHMTQAPGVYHGMDVTIVTTDFGVRH
jgi:uncharacterized protein YkwD